MQLTQIQNNTNYLTCHLSQANQRHGWSFLVVTQLSTSHHLLCVQCGSVCVRALLCLVFIIAVHLGNEVIFYQLSPLTLQGTVNSHNATQTILSPSVPKTVSIRKNKSLKYRRRWGVNPSPLALQASAFATRPP